MSQLLAMATLGQPQAKQLVSQLNLLRPDDITKIRMYSMPCKGHLRNASPVPSNQRISFAYDALNHLTNMGDTSGVFVPFCGNPISEICAICGKDRLRISAFGFRVWVSDLHHYACQIISATVRPAGMNGSTCSV